MSPRLETLFSDREISDIRCVLKEQLAPTDFGLALSEFFASQKREHRKAIREALRPHSELKSSISHCRALGGFIVFSKSEHLGFDIEETHRVSEPIAKRICSTELEFASAPNPAALWCAKEAAFKSLRDLHQPSVVSALQISNWEQILLDSPRRSQGGISESSNLLPGSIWKFHYSLLNATPISHKGLGIALSFSKVSLAVAKVAT